VALRKFEVPMVPADLGEYIDRSFRRMAVVHSSLDLFHAALTIHSTYRLSWYDSIIVGAAMESGCTTLYSADMQHDMQHGAKFGTLRIVDPFR
jgi:predicted nucleic acid-binding protein